MDASISQLEKPAGKLSPAILRHVNQRLAAARAQNRLTQRLAGLLNSAMDAIITVDEDSRIVL